MYFDIMNLDGHEVCTIGNCFNQQKLEKIVLKTILTSLVDQRMCIFSAAMDLQSIRKVCNAKGLECHKAN